MTDFIEDLLDFSESGVWAVSLIFFRISAAMALLPAFGERVTPMRVKTAAAIAFTMIVVPSVWEEAEGALRERSWISMIFAEVVAGLAIGIVFRFMVIVLQIAGTIAAQATSLSQMFGGGLGAEPQPTMSTLLVVSGLCLAVMAGLHVRIAEAFIMSYDLFEIGQGVPSSELSEWGVARVSYSFSLGLSLAGPFVLASVIYNLALGAINRAMPQLMVAFVGAPAISLGGIILLMIVAPMMLAVWLAVFLDYTNLGSSTF